VNRCFGLGLVLFLFVFMFVPAFVVFKQKPHDCFGIRGVFEIFVVSL